MMACVERPGNGLSAEALGCPRWCHATQRTVNGVPPSRASHSRRPPPRQKHPSVPVTHPRCASGPGSLLRSQWRSARGSLESSEEPSCLSAAHHGSERHHPAAGGACRADDIEGPPQQCAPGDVGGLFGGEVGDAGEEVAPVDRGALVEDRSVSLDVGEAHRTVLDLGQPVEVTRRPDLPHTMSISCGDCLRFRRSRRP